MTNIYEGFALIDELTNASNEILKLSMRDGKEAYYTALLQLGIRYTESALRGAAALQNEPPPENEDEAAFFDMEGGGA